MHVRVRRPWDEAGQPVTPEAVYLAQRPQENRILRPRRAFLQSLGWAGLGGLLLGGPGGCSTATDEEIKQAGEYLPQPVEDETLPGDKSLGAHPLASSFPAKRNSGFEYGRAETAESQAARYTNFYEFSGGKEVWRHVSKFRPWPWTLQVDGLCHKPREFDLDALAKQFPFEERCYRHRCVEAWAMCVPWTGFSLKRLIELAEPKAEATHIRLESFYRPEECPNIRSTPEYPWPYIEGLTLAEAANDLAFLATGIYGHPLPRQHGAPVRLVVPWKYGFKSIKSVVRIRFVDERPATFWNTIEPGAYDFPANVNPEIPHPRWSQQTERMLGTHERFDTVLYNGYGEQVAGLYRPG